MQRAIGYHEQALAVAREIGDIAGVATDSFNMAMLHAQQGQDAQALPLALQAAQIFTQIGSPNAQVAQQLVAQLPGGDPAPDHILEQFGQLIAAVAAATHEYAQARAAVEEALPQLTQKGWHIAEPIRRIWAGERDAAALTAGLDDADTLIVSEILKQLKNQKIRR